MRVRLSVGETLYILTGLLILVRRLKGSAKQGELVLDLEQAFSWLHRELPDRVTVGILTSPSELRKLARAGTTCGAFLKELRRIRSEDWGQPFPLPIGEEDRWTR